MLKTDIVNEVNASSSQPLEKSRSLSQQKRMKARLGLWGLFVVLLTSGLTSTAHAASSGNLRSGNIACAASVRGDRIGSVPGALARAECTAPVTLVFNAWFTNALTGKLVGTPKNVTCPMEKKCQLSQWIKSSDKVVFHVNVHMARAGYTPSALSLFTQRL